MNNVIGIILLKWNWLKIPILTPGLLKVSANFIIELLLFKKYIGILIKFENAEERLNDDWGPWNPWFWTAVMILKLPLEEFLSIINAVWGHLFMARVVKDKEYLN